MIDGLFRGGVQFIARKGDKPRVGTEGKDRNGLCATREIELKESNSFVALTPYNKTSFVTKSRAVSSQGTSSTKTYLPELKEKTLHRKLDLAPSLENLSSSWVKLPHVQVAPPKRSLVCEQ